MEEPLFKSILVSLSPSQKREAGELPEVTPGQWDGLSKWDTGS